MKHGRRSALRCEAVARTGLRRRAAGAVEDRFLHLADGLGDLDLAGAGLGAVEDGAAAPHALAVVQPLQPLARRVVAAVEDEAVRVHDRGGAEHRCICRVVKALTLQ